MGSLESLEGSAVTSFPLRDACAVFGCAEEDLPKVAARFRDDIERLKAENVVLMERIACLRGVSP